MCPFFDAGFLRVLTLAQRLLRFLAFPYSVLDISYIEHFRPLENPRNSMTHRIKFNAALANISSARLLLTIGTVYYRKTPNSPLSIMSLFTPLRTACDTIKVITSLPKEWFHPLLRDGRPISECWMARLYDLKYASRWIGNPPLFRNWISFSVRDLDVTIM